MSAAWLALVPSRPADAFAAAEVREDGVAAGWLAVWASEVPGALRADPAAFDPRGAPAAASLVLLDRRLPLDDLAVQEARRAVHGAATPWAVVTTLVNDPVHFRGSLVARRGVALGDDPFARLGVARRLLVGPGLLAAGPAALPGPVVERYAGQPWPQSGF